MYILSYSIYSIDTHNSRCIGLYRQLILLPNICVYSVYYIYTHIFILCVYIHYIYIHIYLYIVHTSTHSSPRLDFCCEAKCVLANQMAEEKKSMQVDKAPLGLVGLGRGPVEHLRMPDFFSILKWGLKT